MSYSFTVQAATKVAAVAAVEAEIGKISMQQLIHVRDQRAIVANATATIGLLHEDQNQDVRVSCNGYLSWSDSAEPSNARITSATINCSANFVDRT